MTDRLLYDESVRTVNDSRIRRELLRLMAIELLLLAVTVIAVRQRLRILCILSVIGCGAAGLFGWDLRLRPLFSYKKYLGSVMSGLRHPRSGIVERVGETPIYEEGVWFYELILDGDRRFLLDAAFQPLRPDVGERIKVMACAQNIVAFSA